MSSFNLGIGLILASAGLVFAAGCTPTPATPETVDGVPVYKEEDRPQAPTVTGDSLDGQAVHFAAHEGNVLVVNFWASWCAPCRRETPHLVEVAAATRDRNVKFVGVNVQDTSDKARAFVAAYQVDYENIFDPGGRVAMKFSNLAPRTIPATVVVDADGNIASVVNGPIAKETLVAILEEVLPYNADI
ncbi:hypothetical protein C1I95_06090 [Micromonospora craterilacus]|uniref:Thioredoxin domain-containing protein n=1 Tax=Micromonospora craterilacus TaxID=1655439 RepID=A0A2W2G5H6_9ACTN|nr:TlpA disulfide reductase family protein [Micromonospora craterilacus]PZG22154.1 hypothetical protein C1I95_06090 [Micromonospora craterilacus]